MPSTPPTEWPDLPADDGEDEDGEHEVPVDLIELFEVLEWQGAVEGQGS